MKAVRWYDSKDVRVEEVEAPKIEDPHDAIVKVTAATLCGSDLHIFNGFILSMKKGDILGHEFIGEVVEKGSAVRHLHVGDRVAVSPIIACGRCYFCKHAQFSLCDNTNPHGALQAKIHGASTAGVFGFSHTFGGYPGAFAEYVRVPHADVGAYRLPDGLAEEKALFIPDAFATGWMAAENCQIRKGDIVAVWGCGAVGQFAVKCAYLLGADRVIAIDRVPHRIAMARREGGAEVLDFSIVDVHESLMRMTGGRGPDACIDAVGMEAHEGGGAGGTGAYDKAKQLFRSESDRPMVLRQMIMACRKGGTLSVAGAYSGFVDKLPFGAFMNKGLTMRSGQVHSPRYLPMLFDRVVKGEADPSMVATHRMPLDRAPEAFRLFNEKSDGCQRVILRP